MRARDEYCADRFSRRSIATLASLMMIRVFPGVDTELIEPGNSASLDEAKAPTRLTYRRYLYALTSAPILYSREAGDRVYYQPAADPSALGAVEGHLAFGSG